MAALDHDGPELIGREAALREIDAILAEARTRGLSVVVRVAGPPGIGKTATLTAFIRGFVGTVLFARAEPGEQASPGAVARALLGTTKHELAGYERARSALYAVAAKQNLLVVDDIQWCDELTLGVIRSLAADKSLAFATIVTDRREDAPELSSKTVGLYPLRRSAAVALIRRRYPEALPTVIAGIIDAADGVPFALTFLADDAAASAGNRFDHLAHSVGTAIARRLARLSPLARDAARLIALLEPPVDINTIVHALDVPLDAIMGALTEIADLVTVDGLLVAFRHAALAGAVAATVPNVVASYARLLNAHDIAETDPVHLATIVRCAVGCGNDERAGPAALRLARTLARAGSLESALRYAEVALRHAARPVSSEYAVEYAAILHQLARYDKAGSFLRHALRRAIEDNDALSAADLLMPFCSIAISLERFPEIDGFCERITTLDTYTLDVSMRIRSVQLIALAYAGRFDEYFQVAAAGKLRWNDFRTLAFVHGLMGDAGNAADAAAAYTAGLRTEHVRQEPVDRVLESTIALMNVGSRALSVLDELPTGHGRHPSERALRVLARICDGRWDEARRLLAETDIVSNEPDQLLELRMMLAALASDDIVEAQALASLRKMIMHRRIRHAVGSARWYVLAARAIPAPDIESFVRETLRVPPMPYAFAALPIALARLSERLGKQLCLDALQHFPVYHSPWHRAHIDLALGLIERDNEKLRAARDALDSLNATAFAAIAGIALPVPRARDVAVTIRLGVTPRVAPPRPKLTRREREVAELTARGATNREIARELNIAERTVETHLTKIFAKLGVTSRSSLAHLLTVG